MTAVFLSLMFFLFYWSVQWLQMLARTIPPVAYRTKHNHSLSCGIDESQCSGGLGFALEPVS